MNHPFFHFLYAACLLVVAGCEYNKKEKSMRETIFKINGVEICTETFGNADDPAVLLIMGATASMVWWDAEFCQQLADKGFFVIRYDNRDVGRSTTYEPQTIHYTFSDLVEDAFGVLD